MSVGASLSRELFVIAMKSSRDKLAPTVQRFKCFRISKVSPQYFRPVSLHDGLWSVHCHPARICAPPIPHPLDAATCPINPNELVFCRSELVCRSELASRAFCHCDEKLARQARSYSSTFQMFQDFKGFTAVLQASESPRRAVVCALPSSADMRAADSAST